MKKIAIVLILCITCMGCSKNTSDKEVPKELVTNTEESKPSKDLDVNTVEDEPAKNLEGNTDEDEVPEIVENTPSMELSKKITSICDEMDQREITTLKADEADTAALFEQLYESIACDWPAREFVEQVKAKGEYTDVCQWYKFYSHEDDESEEEDQNNDYIAAPASVYPSDEYYKVTSFCRNSENEKVFNVIVENPYGENDHLPTLKLDCSDENNIKLVVNDEVYFYIGDVEEKEYSYIGAELKQFVNDNIFVGRYQDQIGITYEFTNDCKAIWGERRFSYDPLVLSLSSEGNTIEVLDDNGRGEGELYVVQYEEGKLFLYQLEYNGDYEPVMTEIAVLTKIE